MILQSCYPNSPGAPFHLVEDPDLAAGIREEKGGGESELSVSGQDKQLQIIDVGPCLAGEDDVIQGHEG